MGVKEKFKQWIDTISEDEAEQYYHVVRELADKPKDAPENFSRKDIEEGLNDAFRRFVNDMEELAKG